MKKLKRLDILFLLTGLVLSIPLLCLGDQALDISIHDTYIVIAYFIIGGLFFLVHAFYSLIYFLIRKNQKYVLGVLHLILGTPLFICFIPHAFHFLALSGVSRRYYSNSSGFTYDQFITVFAIVSAILFVIGNILFLINIISSIVIAIKSR